MNSASEQAEQVGCEDCNDTGHMGAISIAYNMAGAPGRICPNGCACTFGENCPAPYRHDEIRKLGEK